MHNFFAPIHSDGWKFIGLFALVSLLFFQVAWILGIIGVALSVWCVYFFRNPVRMVPKNEGLFVSPADGKVVLIQDIVPPKEFAMGDQPRTRVSIFLNIFDVHVNRIPIAGKIRRILYYPGKFLNASLDKASEFNERQTVILDLPSGKDVAFTQIAGLIARRIRCDVEELQDVQTGETYGLIRFGSRMDIFLPIGVQPQVLVGQKTIAGETILADMNRPITNLQGEWL